MILLLGSLLLITYVAFTSMGAARNYGIQLKVSQSQQLFFTKLMALDAWLDVLKLVEEDNRHLQSASPKTQVAQAYAILCDGYSEANLNTRDNIANSLYQVYKIKQQDEPITDQQLKAVRAFIDEYGLGHKWRDYTPNGETLEKLRETLKQLEERKQQLEQEAKELQQDRVTSCPICTLLKA